MDDIENNLQLMTADTFYTIDSNINYASPTSTNTDNDKNLEIKRTCSVLGCEEYKNIEKDLFFKFPEDSNTRQIWTNLMGRSNWLAKEDSYVCVVHFSVDSFTCNSKNEMILVNKAIPSMRLPNHVLEIEYIEESDTESESNLYNGTQLNGDLDHLEKSAFKPEENIKLLKLFTEVQRKQNRAVALKDKLNHNKKLFLRQKRYLQRLKEIIATKEVLLKRKKKRMLNINLPLLDKIGEDGDDLMAAMPTKYTDDLKNFALSIYKYSPQSYVYIRNALRTMLPNTKVLDGWVKAGYQPRNVMSSKSSIKVVSEQTESELTCKICLD